MHVLLFLLILLAFPVLEIWLLIELASRYGWPLLGYLVLMAILGWRLIQDEKLLIVGRVTQNMLNGGTPAKVLFGSAKNLIAGILLIIPGVITDAIAAILLLIPSQPPIASSGSTQSTGRRAANDDVIEGEFRRED
ncbi:hypothetical protein MTYP_01515 [Methylophilaceae bacterium]|nr:hypothetical protein MTYP_01515 [Methylophilaceae bacterium]